LKRCYSDNDEEEESDWSFLWCLMVRVCTTYGETRGAIISARKGQSREAINSVTVDIDECVAATEYVGSSRAENQEDVKGKLTFVKRRGLVDQRRSFNGEVAASTFSTVVVTEHVGSSRDETQGEQESLSCFTIAMCLCDWISLCLTWVIVLGKSSLMNEVKTDFGPVPLYAFDLVHSRSGVGLMGDPKREAQCSCNTYFVIIDKNTA
ncbi:hypothetical protein Tco_1232998, partial [Tanacetum coccineum]